jgi:hypothetical protein
LTAHILGRSANRLPITKQFCSKSLGVCCLASYAEPDNDQNSDRQRSKFRETFCLSHACIGQRRVRYQCRSIAWGLWKPDVASSSKYSIFCRF